MKPIKFLATVAAALAIAAAWIYICASVHHSWPTTNYRPTNITNIIEHTEVER